MASRLQHALGLGLRVSGLHVPGLQGHPQGLDFSANLFGLGSWPKTLNPMGSGGNLTDKNTAKCSGQVFKQLLLMGKTMPSFTQSVVLHAGGCQYWGPFLGPYLDNPGVA